MQKEGLLRGDKNTKITGKSKGKRGFLRISVRCMDLFLLSASRFLLRLKRRANICLLVH
jgi:hypothetical protein